MKDGAYIVNLNECKSVGTSWITLYANVNSVGYFDSYVEHISEEIKKCFDNKNIIGTIFRIRAYDSISGYQF